ncbi:hypothetical protein BpHYR1_005156 [Brachionus plicatilis]|uniref:Uncharacterized protein n=1 Tax=Brachionus plicatilis TaxID=10195 RepID=A0A3M7PWS8_BRAPC|nr:hypothetical protein BpHYR1_005156 [Brachionus plicatilis]
MFRFIQFYFCNTQYFFGSEKGRIPLFFVRKLFNTKTSYRSDQRLKFKSSRSFTAYFLADSKNSTKKEIRNMSSVFKSFLKGDRNISMDKKLAEWGSQQLYMCSANCFCGRNHDYGGEMLIEVNTQFLTQNINPPFLIVNNKICGNELENEIEINVNHYLGVYSISKRLYLLDDLSPLSYKTLNPNLKITSAFYLNDVLSLSACFKELLGPKMKGFPYFVFEANRLI